MTDLTAEALTNEVLSTLTTVGELEGWLDRRLDGSVDRDVTTNAFRALTKSLLGGVPPNAADWEHLVTKASVRSSKPNGVHAYEACRVAIETLAEMVQSGSLDAGDADQIVTLTSAITLVIAAQRKLRQTGESTIGLLCDKFTDCLPAMAERCQDIWRRHGQMSGVEGPFVWDTRNHEWRLRQDFRAHR